MINETRKFIAVDLRSEFKKYGSIEESMIGTYDKAAKNDLLRRQEGIAEAIRLTDLLRNGYDMNSVEDYEFIHDNIDNVN